MLRARRLESSNFELLASQVIAGLGGGFTTIAAQIGVQSVVSPQDVAVATAIFLLITQIGESFLPSLIDSLRTQLIFYFERRRSLWWCSSGINLV
jgi:hypothetical protein